MRILFPEILRLPYATFIKVNEIVQLTQMNRTFFPCLCRMLGSIIGIMAPLSSLLLWFSLRKKKAATIKCRFFAVELKKRPGSTF